MISNKFKKIDKYTESNSKMAVSFGGDGRISFSEKCWSGLSIFKTGNDYSNVRVEPRLWIEQEEVERVVVGELGSGLVGGTKGKSKKTTTVKKTTVKQLAFVFENTNKNNQDNLKLQSPKTGKQKYISGKGYLQKNNFLRHLINHPVTFQHDAVSFDGTTKTASLHDVIVVDLLKKGKNKIQK